MKQIDVLPDDVLLGIFNFHVNMYPTYTKRAMAWHSLVHVCRRWRSLVFGSPRHLNLRLLCTPKTPVKDTLDIWPALPLTVAGDMASSSSMDNVIAALGQSSRVSEIYLEGLAGWHLEKVLAAMSRPFPELIDLMFFSYGEMLPIIPVPDSFLGGSAPRLQSFSLYGIPFPRLPKLALFATHLVHLVLFRIPHSGNISPEAMAALLSVLSSLQSLTLVFELESPQSHPDWETRPPPPPKRSILPALYKVQFDGVTEYLEDLVIFIDAPQLSTLNITLSHQADFDIPRLAQFINRTPKLRKRDVAHVQFDYTSVGILFGTQISIYCRGPGRLLLSAAQVCNSSSLSSTVEDLYIGHQHSQPDWENDAIENTPWLELLLPFIAVKNLYLSKEFAPGIAAAMQELVGTRITEVLSYLQNIFVEGLEPSGPFQENIEQFLTARQLSDHPVAISVWK